MEQVRITIENGELINLIITLIIGNIIIFWIRVWCIKLGWIIILIIHKIIAIIIGYEG